MARSYYNVTLLLNREHEQRRLNNGGVAPIVKEVLQDFSRRAARVYAWVVMPDHMHLLFSRAKPLNNLAHFVGRIKRQINARLELAGNANLSWRDGYIAYEVNHRSLGEARKHIMNNPVRGRLVKDPKEYAMGATPAEIEPDAT